MNILLIGKINAELNESTPYHAAMKLHELLLSSPLPPNTTIMREQRLKISQRRSVEEHFNGQPLLVLTLDTIYSEEALVSEPYPRLIYSAFDLSKIPAYLCLELENAQIDYRLTCTTAPWAQGVIKHDIYPIKLTLGHYHRTKDIMQISKNAPALVRALAKGIHHALTANPLPNQSSTPPILIPDTYDTPTTFSTRLGVNGEFINEPPYSDII